MISPSSVTAVNGRVMFVFDRSMKVEDFGNDEYESVSSDKHNPEEVKKATPLKEIKEEIPKLEFQIEENKLEIEIPENLSPIREDSKEESIVPKEAPPKIEPQITPRRSPTFVQNFVTLHN